MSRPWDDLETCEGRDIQVTFEPGGSAALPQPSEQPSMRLWSVWDHYQSALIDGLSASGA